MRKETIDFIEKVNNNRGYVDVVDCYRLTHYYCNEYQDILKKEDLLLETKFDPEYDLIYMWERILNKYNNYKKIKSILYDDKIFNNWRLRLNRTLWMMYNKFGTYSKDGIYWTHRNMTFGYISEKTGISRDQVRKRVKSVDNIIKNKMNK